MKGTHGSFTVRYIMNFDVLEVTRQAGAPRTFKSLSGSRR